MRYFLLFILLLFSKLSHAEKDLGCLAAEDANGMASLFPLVKQRSTWEWYRIEITPERTEYAWLVEPGVFVESGGHRIFHGNGMGFAIGLGSANLKNVAPGTGSLGELLRLTTKYAYPTTKPQTDSEREKYWSFVRKSRVEAKILEDDAIVVATFDKFTADAAKAGNPTHVKMRAILPYPGESYECFARLEWRSMRHKKK